MFSISIQRNWLNTSIFRTSTLKVCQPPFVNRIPLDAKEPSVTKTDPLKRALEYKSLINSGIIKNQSELAIYLGKSRAWVSKVMKVLEKGKS